MLRTFPRRARQGLTVICLTSWCIAASVALAQETGGKPEAEAAAQSSPETEKLIELIKGLNAPSLSARENAEADLEQVPFAVWETLPANLELPAETRVRLERIRQTVERRDAIMSAEAAKVSISNPPSLQEALGILTKQSGIPIEIVDAPPGLLPIVADEKPFWQVLDQLLDSADLDIGPTLTEDRALQVGPRDDQRPSRSDAAYAGVFRLEPTAVTARRSMLAEKLSSTRVELAIAWEPRMRPIRVTVPMKHVTAKLDTGETVAPEDPEGEPEASAAGLTFQTDLTLLLPPISREANEIVELSGKIRATLPGRYTTFRIPLSTKTPVRRGAMTVTMDGVRPAGVLKEVRFRLTIDDPADSLQSHQTWVFDNEAYVIDKQGKRRDRLGLEVYRQTAEEVGIALLFELEDGEDGATFVYESPLAIISGEWPFTIKNIKLP